MGCEFCFVFQMSYSYPIIDFTLKNFKQTKIVIKPPIKITKSEAIDLTEDDLDLECHEDPDTIVPEAGNEDQDASDWELDPKSRSLEDQPYQTGTWDDSRTVLAMLRTMNKK